ncbi:MAG: hydantoinase B/oxoprolinase family protein [SAR202 cluster bacterium]|nr:hydantoinase B/oxoprolinase family protein [SAR202 cluster bacterium]|tara:strand:+ start:12897 stop:14648 length:1752 start_codon:yes stop_codon:yes gene_type:complete
MNKQAIDPITLEVMRNAFYSIADEMIVALIRASYSTNIKDRRDASCAIYTSTGDVVVVAQSEIGTPLHLGTMQSAVRSAMEAYPFDGLKPGDAIAMNMPYPAGPGHLNDLCLISPVFYKGEMIAITANQAHHVDMGGFAPGSMPFGVREIFQEGLQIPPIKLFRSGELEPELWSLISQNVRPQVEVKGDLLAQYACNVTGSRRLSELMDRFGTTTVSTYLKEMISYSERRMRAALKKVPKGKYKYEDVIEGDGITDNPYMIRVEIESRGDSIKVDFSKSDDAALGPINCRWPSVAACVYYVFKAILDPELPPNAGAYRPFEIIVRDGSVLSAIYPMSVCNANIITTQRITDVLLGALAEAIPEKIQAACSGTMNLLNIGGTNPRNGVLYNYIETYAGGQGAMHDLDGMHAIQSHMTNTRNAPVEAIEAAYPLIVEKYALIPDSEGAGEYRGGVGLTRILRTLGDVQLTLSSDRASVPPWGLFGGEPAKPSKCEVIDSKGNKMGLPSKVTTSIPNDRVIVTETPGGGGWGIPSMRDPQDVRSDVLDGLVSIERAHDVYKVQIIPETLEIDEDTTLKLRDNCNRF